LTFADDAGRPTTVRYYADQADGTPQKTTTFAYDALGNLTSYNDGTTSAIYAYDELGRKTAETVNYGGFILTHTYEYYKNGLTKTFTGADGITYTYTYNDDNRFAGVHIPGTGYVTVTGYQWTRPSEITLPGGSRKSYAYDPFMRLENVTVKDPGGNIMMRHDYAYDKVDNIVGKSTEHGDYAYTYDGLYRLTASDNPDGTADEAYTYDAGTWTYNSNNELESYGGVTFTYDANGNTIQKNDGGVVTRFIYDIEDRLIRVEDQSGGVISQYYYDPFGRRLYKEVGGTRTYFHYSGEGLIGEYDAAGAEIKTYGYRPGSGWTADPLFMKQSSQYYFYHNDRLGTPQKITMVSGAVVWSARYGSFGKAEIQEGATVENNLRFPGQYYDAETGLHYNWMRYYDPKTGRYTRTDPIGFNGGDENLYNYVWGNPNFWVDPSGELPILLPVAIWFVKGFVIDFTLDIAIQALYKKGFECIDWTEAATAGFWGGVTGGVGKAPSSFKYGKRLFKFPKVRNAPKSEGGLNLYKWEDATSTKATGWKEGDHLFYLPNKGSIKANRKQNAGRLREAMRKGKPIYDSYRNPVSGRQIKAGQTPYSKGRFLNAERQLLESRGWKYNTKAGAYYPPGK